MLLNAEINILLTFLKATCITLIWKDGKEYVNHSYVNWQRNWYLEWFVNRHFILIHSTKNTKAEKTNIKISYFQWITVVIRLESSTSEIYLHIIRQNLSYTSKNIGANFVQGLSHKHNSWSHQISDKKGMLINVTEIIWVCLCLANIWTQNSDNK